MFDSTNAAALREAAAIVAAINDARRSGGRDALQAEMPADPSDTALDQIAERVAAKLIEAQAQAQDSKEQD